MRYNAFFGELPLGAFKPIGGKMTLHGGGNPISAVADAVSNVVGGAVNTVEDLGAGLDRTIRDVIPGGWTTAALLAAGAYYSPEIEAWIDATGAVVPGSAGVPPEVSPLSGASSTDVSGWFGTPAGEVAPAVAETAPVFTAELPAGSAYVAPEVTTLGNVAGTTEGMAEGTALAGMGENAYTAAQDAQDALAMAGNPAANATLGGVGAIGAANAYPALNAAAAGDVAAAGGTTAAALKAAGLGAAGGTALADILPYMAGGQLATGLLQANSATEAANIQADAAAKALAQQQANFNTINAQQAPYRAAGYGALNQLANLGSGQTQQYDAAGNVIGTTANPSDYLTHQFNAADLAAGLAPNYNFMLQQGQMANQRAANMGGGALGGNALQGLNKYTQDYAGNAYQNAFTNYQNQRQNIYNTLAGIAGIGQTGQTAANTAGTNLANAAAQLGVGSAGAQAAGQVGQTNALANTVGNVGNTYMLANLLGQRGAIA